MKHTLKSVRTLAATLITFGSLVGGANAAVTIYIYETGGNLRFEGNGGTLNTTALNLTSNNSNSGNAGFTFTDSNGSDNSALGLFPWGPAGSLSPISDVFDGTAGNIIETPSAGWTIGNLYAAAGTYVSGSTFVLWESGAPNPAADFILLGGNGYSDGFQFDGVSDVLGMTLAGAGLTANQSYTISWGAGPSADSLTFVTSSAVPEPSSALLLSLGAFGLAARRRRMK